jgi:hypothetical protein
MASKYGFLKFVGVGTIKRGVKLVYRNPYVYSDFLLNV